MQHKEIVDNTSQFLQQYVGERDIDPEEEIFSSGLVNSLFAMQLVLFLEKEYNLKIDHADLDLQNFKSLNSIGDFVISKKQS